MMSGTYRILVRNGFSEESVWRSALGNETYLLVHSSIETCLDAPDFVPSGSTVADHVTGSLPRKSHRFDQSKNYM